MSSIHQGKKSKQGLERRGATTTESPWFLNGFHLESALWMERAGVDGPQGEKQADNDGQADATGL